MGMYKVGDKVKVVYSGLDISEKTATVTDEALPGHDYVLVELDNPDRENVSQLGRISLKETWLTQCNDMTTSEKMTVVTETIAKVSEAYEIMNANKDLFPVEAFEKINDLRWKTLGPIKGDLRNTLDQEEWEVE